MELDIYQIDAFAEEIFSGNPAAVVPLEQWLPEPMMQSIAAENNLAETAFYVKESEGYRIRWFTPEAEVPLCGHATLASAFVLFQADTSLGSIEFQSKSGPLKVTRSEDLICLDFPANPLESLEASLQIEDALGIKPRECLKTANGRRYVAILEDEDQLIALDPDMSKVQALDSMTLGVTSASIDYDFVSRFFAPKLGIPEDPVTGAFHTSLIPYWSYKLGKTNFRAKQVSKRGGELFCEILRDAEGDRTKDRVRMSGRAVKYLQGKIYLPD